MIADDARPAQERRAQWRELAGPLVPSGRDGEREAQYPQPDQDAIGKVHLHLGRKPLHVQN
jgi:hypothetical protein